MMMTFLNHLASQHGEIKYIDLRFAELVVDTLKHTTDRTRDRELLAVIAVAASVELRNQNVCVPLKPLLNTLQAWLPGKIASEAELDTFLQQNISDDCGVLKYVYGALYIGKYWFIERDIASRLVRLSNTQTQTDVAGIQNVLPQLFDQSDTNTDTTDWQLVATVNSLLSNLSIITGGPGTGKTTTVLKLLCAHLMLDETPASLNIRLAAPTGKAAMRLSESIKKGKPRLPIETAVTDLIPEQASTIHRMLGNIPHSSQFRHNKDNPLQADILVLDEASMVDINLMHALLCALPSHCKLIILGDKNQLASVEAGSVMAALCNNVAQLPTGLSIGYDQAHFDRLSSILGKDISLECHQSELTFSRSVSLLRKTYRNEGAILAIANSVNEGNVESTLNVLQQQDPSVNWLAEFSLLDLARLAAENYQGIAEVDTRDYQSMFDCFNRFRVLTATKEGEQGGKQINAAIEKQLSAKGLIDVSEEYYHGRPIMILENDYNLQLFNGDIGIIVEDPESDAKKVVFEQSDGGHKVLLAARLPKHETAYAMTIHKSQGSEFQNVAVVLPVAQQYLQHVTRELLYTGITRASKSLYLYGNETAIKTATVSPTERYSRLTEHIEYSLD